MLEHKYNEVPEHTLDTVPWSANDAFKGVLFTLVPWFLISFCVASLGGGETVTKPLSFQLDLFNAIFSLVFAVVVEGIFLIAPFLYARRAQQADEAASTSIWEMLGFRGFAVGRATLLIVGLLVAIFLVNYAYQFIITAFQLPLTTNDQALFDRGKIAPISLYATLFAATFIAPFCEEVFFRSFVFMGLRKEMSIGWAVVISALIFAAAHGDLGSFPVLLFIGLALAILRWQTNSFWPGFILHFLNNGISAVILILALNKIIAL